MEFLALNWKTFIRMREANIPFGAEGRLFVQ